MNNKFDWQVLIAGLLFVGIHLGFMIWLWFALKGYLGV